MLRKFQACSFNIDSILIHFLIFFSFCDELLIRQSSLGSNRLVVPPREIPQSWSFHVGQKIGRRGNFFLPICSKKLFFESFFLFNYYFLKFLGCSSSLTCFGSQLDQIVWWPIWILGHPCWRSLQTRALQILDHILESYGDLNYC